MDLTRKGRLAVIAGVPTGRREGECGCNQSQEFDNKACIISSSTATFRALLLNEVVVSLVASSIRHRWRERSGLQRELLLYY